MSRVCEICDRPGDGERCRVCGRYFCGDCGVIGNEEVVCSEECAEEVRHEAAAVAHRDVAIGARAAGKILRPQFKLNGSQY